MPVITIHLSFLFVMIVDRGTGGREGARYRSGEVEDVWHLGALLGQRAGGETLVVQSITGDFQVYQGAVWLLQPDMETVKCHQMSSNGIKCHQMPSNIIRCHQMSSPDW